jgi:uncharacterized protein YggE
MRYVLSACILLTSLVVAVAQDGPPQASSQAQGPAAGVTVEGVGTAKLQADTLEFRGMIMLTGATLADVMQEYDRATTRLAKAVEQAGTKGLTSEMRGALLSFMSDNQFRQRQQQAMRYGQEAPQKCVVRDYVTLRVPIEGMAPKDVTALVVSLLDVAAELDLKDPSDNPGRYDMYGRPLPSDLPDGWTPGMSFVLRDPGAIYSAAVKEAMKDARAKAEVQAGLAGTTLGKIVGVETTSGGTVGPGRVRELQHRVVLRVRFELTRT